MALRTKPHNRRHSRAYVLDVRLSSSQRRENLTRRLGLMFLTMLLLAATAFGGWRGVEFLLRRFVYENPVFAIQTLRVETDGVLSAEQIRSWAGVRRNDNVLALDLARVERDLRLVPAIESVMVERVLPGALHIRVTEREPIAQVTLAPWRGATNQPAGFYTLDAAGVFMFPVDPSQRAMPGGATNDHLPVLTGLPTRDLRPGRASEVSQAHAALELVQAFQRSPMAGLVDLKQIEVGVPGVLIATTAQGNELSFSLHDFPGQLRRWRLVYDHAQRFSKHILSLDLAVANNSPLLWTDINGISPPPAPPKPIKASPYRKKHV